MPTGRRVRLPQKVCQNHRICSLSLSGIDKPTVWLIYYDSEDAPVDFSDPLKTRAEPKLSKLDIMPTWAATYWLLSSFILQLHLFVKWQLVLRHWLYKKTTNGWRSILYTVLLREFNSCGRSTSQSSIHIGSWFVWNRPDNSVINWICWLLFETRGIHVCVTSLHPLGRYIEDSYLDSIETETGLYSPAAPTYSLVKHISEE